MNNRKIMSFTIAFLLCCGYIPTITQNIETSHNVTANAENTVTLKDGINSIDIEYGNIMYESSFGEYFNISSDVYVQSVSYYDINKNYLGVGADFSFDAIGNYYIIIQFSNGYCTDYIPFNILGYKYIDKEGYITDYANINDVINEINNHGGTIKLYNDITEENLTKVTYSGTIIIDLNGYNIKSDSFVVSSNTKIIDTNTSGNYGKLYGGTYNNLQSNVFLGNFLPTDNDTNYNYFILNDDNGVILTENQTIINDVVTIKNQCVKHIIDDTNLYWSLDSNDDLIIDLLDNSINDNTLNTIPNYNYDNNNLSPWNNYSKDIESVTIKDGIVSVGDYAFYQCISLTDVKISNSVTSIGSYAFDNTPFIENNTNEFIILGDNILYQCNSTDTVIIISQNIKSVTSSAFKNCSNLDTIYCQNDSIKSNIADNNSGINVYNINNSLEDISIEASIINDNLVLNLSTNTNDINDGSNLFADLVITINESTLSTQDYTYQDNILTIPLEKINGDIFINTVENIADIIKSYSLSLTGNIGMNVYATLTDDTLNDNQSYIQFTYPNGDIKKVSISNGQKQSNDTYKFTCDVYATQMSDIIKVKIVSSTSETEEVEISVKGYCEEIIKNPTNFENSEKLVELVKSMLNYGAYSQEQFDSTSILANSNLADNEKELPNDNEIDLSSYSAEITYGSATGVNITSASLLLGSETSIRCYMDIDNDKEFIFYINGTVTTPHLKDDKYYIEISNINATDLENMYNIEVTTSTGENVLTLKYGAFSYVNAVLNNDNSTDTLKNVVKSLYVYNQKADDYFSKN